MKCPACDGPAEVDYTPEFNATLLFERVCFGCGWFDEKRYATVEEAEAAGGGKG